MVARDKDDIVVFVDVALPPWKRKSCPKKTRPQAKGLAWSGRPPSGLPEAIWSGISPSVSTTFRCSSRLPSAPFAPPHQRFWLRLPEQAHKRGRWHARLYQKKHSPFFFLAMSGGCCLPADRTATLTCTRVRIPQAARTPYSFIDTSLVPRLGLR